MRTLLLCVAFLFCVEQMYGQSQLIDSLLTCISDKQIAATNENYQEGMFPSQRIYLPLKRVAKEDDNIFFTGLIVWTLKSIYPSLSIANQKIADTICSKAIANYARYQNRDGQPVYNFWRTRPSHHFPNSRYFSSKKKYIIPDDLDDTSIIYLSENYADSLKKMVRELMTENANGQKRTIRNTFKKYQNVPAYSTWFGKKMPVDFDICVQANGLRFVLDNNFVLNKYDSATLALIKDMVLTGRYIKRSHYASPHYQKKAIVLYHIARLVAAHPELKALSEIKSNLMNDLRRQYLKTTTGMERVLLQTSLIRMGEFENGGINISKREMARFYFFVANMTSVFPNPIKGVFANSWITNFFYRSEAYYLMLLLENEVLKLRFKESG